MKKMSQIYVLELEDGKHYVGKTDNVHKRFQEHLTGRGSAWTKEFKPIRIAEVRPVTSVHDETNITKDLMKKHGIDNVRGGAYCQVELPEGVEDTIRHELRSADDKCFKCGKPGHFAKYCKRKSSFTANCGCGRDFLDFDEFMSHQRSCLVKQLADKKPSSKKGACYRCGRPGHYSPDCYATWHVDGYRLDDE